MTNRVQIGLVFIIINLSFGYLVYPNLIYMIAKTAHWEVVMYQCLLQLFLIKIYIKGLNYFPDYDVIDIFKRMGKWVAFILLTPLLINLIALFAFNIRLHTDVIISIFLNKTPYWSIMSLFLFISVYTAVKGIGTILRSSLFLFLVIIPLVVFNIATSVVNFDFHNIRPTWDLSHKFLLNEKFIHLLGFSPFLFLGFIKSNKKWKFSKLFLLCLITFIFFLSVVYIPIFIFGQETVNSLTYPFLEAMDSVDISWFPFNRQSIFFGISLVGLVILANAVILWMIGRIMLKIFKFNEKNCSYWIIAFSLIAFIFAKFTPNKSVFEKYFLWCMAAQAYYMIIIPFTIFIYGFISEKRRVKL